MTANDAVAQAKAVIIAMKLGKITYDEAKAECEPLFAIANEKIAEIAKRYGKKAYTIKFASFAR